MRRWTLYTLIGLVFGILDWFYLDWLTHDLGRAWMANPALWRVVKNILNYGIWLVPILPIVISESRKTPNVKGPAYAGMLTWGAAVLSYYGYYGLLLSLGKLPSWTYLNVFGPKFDGFWLDYWRKLRHIIFEGILQWLPVALVGGALLGILAWRIVHRRQDPGQSTTPNN
jgi:hypothetical protein